MQCGELTLHQKSGEVIGHVKVKLNFDLPDEMMQMLIYDISNACKHWAERIIVNSHNM